MTDVARLAGVSQKTVSRVINGERYVSDNIRQRVLRAAQQLGYRRNTAARALITGRFRRIGFVSLGTADYGPASLLIALERATRAAGFSFTVATTLEGGHDKISDAIRWLLEQGIDGIVISEPVDEGEKLEIDPGVPVLSFGKLPGLSGSHVVFGGADGVAAARTATEHLLELGHDTVWHLAGPQRWWAARDRREGWRRALDDAGATPPPLAEGDWSPASGYKAGTALASDPSMTAVFVANDEMAIGMIRALNEAGRAVPDDVSVIGFDDIPSAAYLSPPLTTMRQDFEAVAAHGLDLLIQQIEGTSAEPDSKPLRTDFPADLIVRQSAAAPSHDRRNDAPSRKEVQ
ncbi:LacI family DNA-binding transcriptional regulator [Phytoactinopolyspora endophytica]|uniref:LacI family DNA-binding transcriptional regulator n=1 Tax=Phytoactinopolyspora endophytica TaxID=1642495 RepID=UPI00101D0821|nr:LacI family DNA-binding transcriptional regulator [Phytoactinopolyspora endophytica]